MLYVVYASSVMFDWDGSVSLPQPQFFSSREDAEEEVAYLEKEFEEIEGYPYVNVFFDIAEIEEE